MQGRYPFFISLFVAASTIFSAAAHAEVNIGVTLSTTGPAASLGIPERNAVALLPKEIGGQKINYLVLDDASDSTNAVKNARKLTAESRVDLLVGSSTSPNALAMIDVASESMTPMIAVAASAAIVQPMDAKRNWVFKPPQHDSLMARAVLEHMSKSNIKSLGFIGFNDAYGESWWKEVQKAADIYKVKIVASERFSRTDNNVVGQVLKLMAGNPEAVMIAGSGTPAAMPQIALKQRGYQGRIYQTHGVANNDFLRVGGKDVEGAYLPAGPLLVAQQLPSNHSSRQRGVEFINAYESAYGPGTANTFAAHVWDIGLWLQQSIPVALKSGAKPGTPEFRKALRDALELLKEVRGAHGVYNLSSNDHNGLDERARVIVKIEGGQWKYVP
ncbi:ABC transporter substrate-binding protein [Noviherbaspirillum sp. Root189]|uniref:ABC transporter substrate-binding protein n=1 Tax=Noviherbaspirillum sp. Root189 TaxID=1736487 RepID=UPI00070F9AF0|nr:ABC transporter substrate-binding protein [Noviherbaspirillum sp. Root189]KRB83898.1 branched-chain amino acid ABC transporter substrate-binding protein [Noviherbaspirillum sp. Root189]